MKKLWIMSMMLVLTITLAACSDKSEPAEQEEVNEEANAQIAVVEKFIDIAYFDEGTYEDFKALYANPEKANTEEEFNEFRKSNEPKDTFPVDNESAEDVKQHLIAKKTDDMNADVYWVEDVKKVLKEDEGSSVWSVTKVEDEWKLR